MKFTSFLHKKLIDLLNDRRIVVWYDGEGDFKALTAAFKGPNCEVLSAEASVLKSRRRADEVYRLMNESENPAERDRCLLIYIPRPRGATEDEKMRDPFEVYAMAGTPFGDTEDQKIESLARQAMPQKAEEITRLFREGKPDIDLLDGLEKTQQWPVLLDVFRTETPADIVALALCDAVKAEEVDARPGCIEELLRLFESAVGFKPVSESRKWKTLRPKAAEYVLFSEFVFDMPDGPPDAFTAVPHAGVDARAVIYAACDRMRADSGLRETYVELAQGIEDGLRLADLMPEDFDPGERDTFPCEERRLLGRAVDYVIAGDLAAASTVIENRKRSIWYHDSARSLVWTVLERAAGLAEAVRKVSGEPNVKRGVGGLVKAYTEDGWSDLDRATRLFETALTACADEEMLTPVADLCRRRYRETATVVQHEFLTAIQAEGWPPENVQRQTRVFDQHVAPVLEHREKIAFFLVDSLRYEMGRDLYDTLDGIGEVEIAHAAAVVPTVTAYGMAALMPGADGMLQLSEKGGGLVVGLGKRLLKTSADRMKLLSETYGDRFFETTLDELLGSVRKISSKLDNVDLLVLRTQDPDNIAENLGAWRARRYLSDVIADLAAAVRLVVSLGFSRVLITADHGHMMFPEIPAGDVVQGPPGAWLENKRRYRLGSGLSGAAGTVILHAENVGIQGNVQEICLPIGFSVFSNHEGYFHGGLSLQEAVIPVITLRAHKVKPVAAGKPNIAVRYRSDGFTSRVIGLTLSYEVGQLRIGGIPPIRVRVEAYDGTGAKAGRVGGAADCDARDEKTREVTLKENKQTPVPVLIEPDFGGSEIEIRVSDPQTGVVWVKHKLKNAMVE